MRLGLVARLRGRALALRTAAAALGRRAAAAAGTAAAGTAAAGVGWRGTESVEGPLLVRVWAGVRVRVRVP